MDDASGYTQLSNLPDHRAVFEENDQPVDSSIPPVLHQMPQRRFGAAAPLAQRVDDLNLHCEKGRVRRAVKYDGYEEFAEQRAAASTTRRRTDEAVSQRLPDDPTGGLVDDL